LASCRKKDVISGSWNLARPERFELPTPRFVVWCSIQLSYGRAGPHVGRISEPLSERAL
jgi:hypothetical protein